MIKVYNRGRRQFQHSLDGVNYVSDPGKFVDVPDEVAEIWLKGYPRDIISGDAAKGDVNRAESEVRKKDEEIRNLRAELDLYKRLLESHGITKPVPSILGAVETPAEETKVRAKPGRKPKVEQPA